MTGSLLKLAPFQGVPIRTVKPGARKILLADDEPSMRRLFRCVLTREGYAVSEAENQEEALEILRDQGPHLDLVILHFSRFPFSQKAVLGFLQQEMADLPVLMITGDVITRDDPPPGVPFLAKPFSPHLLVDCVTVLLS